MRQQGISSTKLQPKKEKLNIKNSSLGLVHFPPYFFSLSVCVSLFVSLFSLSSPAVLIISSVL